MAGIGSKGGNRHPASVGRLREGGDQQSKSLRHMGMCGGADRVGTGCTDVMARFLISRRSHSLPTASVCSLPRYYKPDAKSDI